MSYQTDNIAIAAALRTHGHTIQEINVVGRRAVFTFDNSAQADANDISSGAKLVSALIFHEQIRRLSGLAKSMSNQASMSTMTVMKVNQ